MGKIRYLLRRISKMNCGDMVKQARAVGKKCGKPTFVIFCDMVWCGIRYMAGYMDYVVFAFYNLSAKQRKTYVTRGRNNEFVKLLNDRNYWALFSNKIEFNKKFSDYIKRDWLDLRTASEEEFSAFLEKHGEAIVKPIDCSCGKGIEKISAGSENITSLYRRLKENGQILAEEVVLQHSELMRLFPNCLNTIRLVTINYHGKVSIVFAGIRMGMGNTVVDNLNSGGLAAVIDTKTGIIKTPGANKCGQVFDKHPDTGTEIKGFKIPAFDEAVKLVKSAAEVVPQIGYTGWDIAICDSCQLIIEGNQYPGHDIYQMPCLVNDGYGILPVLNKAVGRK